MDFKICSVSDKHLLRDLAEKTYRDTFAPYNTREDMDAYVRDSLSVQRMEQELSDKHSVFVLAVRDGKAAGYLKLNYGPAQTELQDDTSLEVERIYILRDYQGGGVGQQLMDYAVNRATEEGLAYIWLGVWEKNPGAIRFYERNGFYRFGEHIFQLGQDKQLDYLLRKDL